MLRFLLALLTAAARSCASGGALAVSARAQRSFFSSSTSLFAMLTTLPLALAALADLHCLLLAAVSFGGLQPISKSHRSDFAVLIRSRRNKAQALPSSEGLL